MIIPWGYRVFNRKLLENCSVGKSQPPQPKTVVVQTIDKGKERNFIQVSSRCSAGALIGDTLN